MPVPHVFPSLTHAENSRVLLIVGSGLSYGVVPGLPELEPRLRGIATNSGIEFDPLRSDFFALAQALLNRRREDGLSEDEARLSIAESLALFDDRRWFGEIGMPLSGNTPRHRVIARFAVEERWSAVVTLNWDALLETGFESVGLGTGAASPRPWSKTSYCCATDNADVASLGGANVVPVIKPHGCVRHLSNARRAREREHALPRVVFKLTQDEMDALPPEQRRLVDSFVHIAIAQHPVIAVGWSAKERYLRDLIASTARDAGRSGIDNFSLIDLAWSETHAEISSAYDLDRNGAFAQVFSATQPTTDSMFLWLQARYAIEKLMANDGVDFPVLSEMLDGLSEPGGSHFAINWADSWLPNWVRLCWRSGAISGVDVNTNQRVEPWDIPITPRDVHVPYARIAVHRKDLQAAARLLVLLRHVPHRFDCVRFPGGLWDSDELTLYIPLPGWRTEERSADLVALKPLAEALRGVGFIKRVKLIWLNETGEEAADYDKKQLGAQLQRLFPLASLAQADALDWVDLDVLVGGGAHV